MTHITRKDFFRLSSAAMASAGLAACANGSASATKSVSAAPSGAKSRKTLIRNADILTMNSKREELTGHDVLIVDGKISQIGKNISAPDAEQVDAAGMVLMPGMIDGHRHVWQCIDAGRLSKFHPAPYSATYQEWKMRTIVSVNADEMYLAGLVGGLLAIDSGVTTVLDYAHGQINQETAIASATGLKASGIGGFFAFQLGVSSSHKPGDTVSLEKAHSERIAQTSEVHWTTADALKRDVFSNPDDVLQFGLCPASGMGDPLDLIRDEWTRARDYDVQILGAHIHKPVNPYPAGHMGHRDSGMLDLADAGLLGPDYHLSHANRLTDAELAALKATGGMVCATAMGEFPYMTAAHRGPSSHGRAREAGVAVGIGVDVPLALNQNYFEHVRAAFWNLYLSNEGREIVSDYQAHDVLDYATNLGAQAVRLGDTVGSIEPGKRADLVLVRTDRPGFGRQGTLAERVVTFATREDIDSVWIAGGAKKRNGRIVDFDLPGLMENVYAAQRRFGPLAKSITFS